ncbi:MAG: Rrf2 family transcriptional regulator [Oscillospiraceae bacterium]|nr:Rrf2 family transcriptional regulator [Oscillospiraceae bacterium]MDE7295322.1 Rrf2 family transcriptional regulator [Oscillospiraceae bacterium]
MCLTLESDYAVRIIGCLASEGKRIDAKNISEKTGVSLRFSLKILRKLVSGELVRSFKGMQGGYELAKSPDSISLFDVIECVEGEYYLNRCHEEDFVCTRDAKGCCAYQNVYREINEIVTDKLKSYTFADLIK